LPFICFQFPAIVSQFISSFLSDEFSGVLGKRQPRAFVPISLKAWG
jgi:hypothetical protein